jgi:drug/metabolite transporter (DMT)-like permease
LIPALATCVISVTSLQITPSGALLAATSGALTSGLGYAVWYYALRGHTAMSAAVSQLAVPVLAAAAGATLLGESLSPRLVIAALLTLGGIALATVAAR